MAWVEEDGEVHAVTVQQNPPWGLDRIDQRNLPLNSIYDYQGTGAGVNVYVMDTGIRVTHTDFGGRAVGAYTSILDGQGTNDCNGHGTHVAATLGGATFGAAKNVRLHAVRVLDCTGNGSWSSVISGVNWVTANHVKPAVANMSLGGFGNTTVDAAIQGSIDAGIVYVVSAGNDWTDACTYSPARVGPAITVGASNANDSGAVFTNQGTCLDIFAPGDGVLSAWNTTDTATNILTGTSMASPHVAGVAAVYLSAHKTAPPYDVANAIVGWGTPNVLTAVAIGSPNLLLNTSVCNGAPCCTPKTCADFGSGFCGSVSNGCGGTLTCGCSGLGLRCYDPDLQEYYWSRMKCSSGKCVVNPCY